ncbi:relaxase domain-containing protein [Clavibacter nebraskensis]|uniref:relaxase domain-containing protein n=1 Tax=Clavibacter nebraskensis TaxID=31963 RepID=UPI00200C4D06|nr:relaxase domain-containing protein [Clavibacter nebraskensis]
MLDSSGCSLAVVLAVLHRSTWPRPSRGARFLHYFDRQGKPALHVHVDLINAVLGSDGQVSGMDVATFRSADELAHDRYASSLMSGLRELVGVASEISYGDDRRTHFEVAGCRPGADLEICPGCP